MRREQTASSLPESGAPALVHIVQNDRNAHYTASPPDWSLSDRCRAGGALTLHVDTECQVADATARIVRMDLGGPREDVFVSEDSFWLDLSLAPRRQDTEARFVDHWRTDRFQRVGPIFVFPPSELLQIRSQAGLQSSLVCQLRREAVYKWIREDLNQSNHQLAEILNISNINIRELLTRLVYEMRNPGFAGDMLVDLIIGHLSIELSRYWVDIKKAENSSGGLSAHMLCIVDDRLSEARRCPSLAELAHLCGISPRQLTRGFRVSRGCSIGVYAKQRRTDLANQLLQKASTVKEVALVLGFASASTFIHAYVRDTGSTPGRFRLEARSEGRRDPLAKAGGAL